MPPEPGANLGATHGAIQGALANDVNRIGPFATTYQTPVYNSPQAFAHGSPTSSNTSPGLLDQFFGKIGSVFKESGHMFMGAADWVGHQLVDAGKAAINEIPSVTHFAMDAFDTWSYRNQSDGLLSRTQQAQRDYQTGKISLAEFNSEMKQITSDTTKLNNQMNGLTQKIGSDGGAVIKNTIGTAADIITVMTAGLSSPLTLTAEQGTKDTAAFLAGDATRAIFQPAEEAVAKLAANKAIFDTLPTYIQDGVRASITDTFINAGAHLTAPGIARTAVANLAFKYPLAFNYLSGTGQKLYSQLASGKYGNAVKTLGFNGLLLFSGGPIGQAFKYGGDALHGLSGKIFGSTSFLDELSKAAGYHPNDIFLAIKDNPDLVKSFQALEATNLAAENGRIMSAVYRVTNGLKANSPDIFGNTPQEFVQNVQNWHLAQKDLTETMTAKVGAAEANKYVVGRWAASTKNWVATQLTKPYLGTGGSFDTQQMLADWQKLKAENPSMAFANSKNLDTQISHIIQTSNSAEDMFTKISAIKAASEQTVPKALAERLAAKGYLAIAPAKLEAPFVQGAQKLSSSFATGSEFFTKAVKPLPVLKEVGSFLTNLGMSPERSQSATYELFNANLAENLKTTSVIEKNMIGETSDMQATTMIHKISDFVNQLNQKAVHFNLHTAPITDWRQLTTKELSTALGVSKSQATEVAKAIHQSMLDVSLAERGLGAKMLDMVQAVGAGKKFSMNGYLRLQGAGRFAWNPFFKMKLAAKTEILSQLEAGGKNIPSETLDKGLNMVFQGRYGNLQDTANLLESRGFFSGGMTGEASNETAAGYNTLTSSEVLNVQKKSIAGLVSSQAERAGMNVQTFIDSNPTQVRDTIASILHYNPNADFLNSPMARTLNFAFFPFRFNIKVASFMARALSRQDALTQVAVIHGLMQAHNFLTSQQGQVWYSQNSDALGLLTYFTPLETLSTISALGHIGHESIGSFGELGGLPVGFIPQLLQAEGLWHPNGAYVNPKTGQPGTNYIPQTGKAKLATALSSFIGSLFTYPGSEAGLPSKAGTLAKATQGLTGSKAADWTKEPQTNLTPQQQQFMQAVQGLQQSGQANPLSLPSTPAENTTVPMTGSATAQPYYKKTGSSTPSAKKLKKTQEPVSLLPGQTKIGVVQ